MDPQPGDFALTPSLGIAGPLIRLGQWLNGDGFADYQHAFVYLGDAQILEAVPSGSRIASIGQYAPDYLAWYRAPDEARERILMTAQGMTGIPYSWLDYAAIGAHRLHLWTPGLRQYIAATGHQICSQLVDECYRRSGVQLFDDGRWPGYVTPLALYQLILAQRATT